MAAGKAPHLLLVDGANTLYRAFFAIPHLRAPDGTPTNAAYGFENMLLKVVREERPDRVVVVFDARGKTFRHRLYGDYKANREAQPEDLSAQFPLVRELCEAHGFPIVTVADCEADDVIATLVERAPEGSRIAIVSTDKDLMQLVDDRVTLLDGMKDRRYGPAEVEERFGVAPERVLDLRALVGDPSDNIPGVKGIGEKGAAKLIGEWGDLETLLDHVEEIKPPRAKNALASHADEARLSKQLATLVTDVELPLDPGELPAPEADAAGLRALYERLGFTRLLDGLDDGGSAPGSADSDVAVDVVSDEGALDSLIDELLALPSIPLLPVVSAGGILGGDVVGLAVARGDARAAYVPLGDAGLPLSLVVEKLRPLLEAPGRVAWMAADAKQAQVLFGEQGLDVALAHFDAGIAGLLVDPTGSAGIPALAARHLGRSVQSFEGLAGRGAKARPVAELPVDEVAAWAAGEVCALREIVPVLQQRLDDDGLAALFEEVELPLTRALARMERAGVRVDELHLEKLSAEYKAKLESIEAEIYGLAGQEFLISSPKQLQRILFEDLKLPVVKKTKTGYSTDESVLEQLASQHDLPAQILRHRRLSKLRNTYVDALPPLVNPRTGRIHPTFHQLGAATGRLSAANPNVQNIPIRSEEGVRIREAFVPADGCLLLSADYSQVELRILAHYSADESLLEGFRRGEDVHRQTAADVAGVSPEDVTPEMRARAKAVNFGIIYGLSAFGLANQLGIASAEAQETIDAYFQRYRGVRRFLDTTIEEARERGHVTTYLGRRRYLPDLASRNRTLRHAAERMAVNTVIQGTAADLIKKAMVALDAALPAEGLSAKMILQVHDELVFEAPPSEIEVLSGRVRECMEQVLAFRVPLEVEIGVGANWREAH